MISKPRPLAQPFTRTFGPRRFPISTASEAPDWQRIRKESAGDDEVFVGDLTLDCWRPAQLATELAAQLGVTAELCDPSQELDQRSEAQRRLDNDSAGDHQAQQMITKASIIADALLKRAKTVVWVLLPADGSSVSRLDQLLVEVLDDAFASTAHSIELYYGGDALPGLPDHWSLSWRSASDLPRPTRTGTPGPIAALPGLITPDIAQAVTGEGADGTSVIELAGGCRLIDPADRPAGSERAAHSGRLAKQVGGRAPMLNAVLQARSDGEVNPWVLVEQAAQQIAQGGDGLPHELLTRARAAMPSPGKAALCDLLGRSLDLVHGRFAEIAATDPPSDSLKPWLRGMLWHVRGWALTMSGRAEEALQALAQSRMLLGDDGTVDEFLSTLNIAALARLRAGDWTGAWAAELELQKLLANLPAPNYQLSYINAMNMARLQRRSESVEGQLEHFGRAFDTARGLRSDSDGIHENLTDARLHTDPAAARAAFLRAAVLLLACPWPDRISPRVLSALPRRTPTSNASDTVLTPDFVDDLAQRVTGCLRSVLEIADAGVPAGDRGVAFRHAEDLPPDLLTGGDWRLVAEPGCILAVTDKPSKPISSSAGLRELAAVVGRHLDLAAGSTVLVDDRLGYELPNETWEIVAVAMRLGLRLRDGSRVLTDDRSTLIEGVRAELASGLAALERDGTGRLVARFRRYRPPITVEEPAAALLLALQRRPWSGLPELAAETGQDSAGCYLLLRELEDARLAQLRY